MKMVNKQGIELLEKCREEIQNYYGRDTELTEEISSYLTTNGWIPVSERLTNMEECQKNDCRFIVTDGNRVYEDSFDYMTDGYIEPHWIYSTMCQPTAWQPLPEPYKELATDNNVVTKSSKDNNALTIGDKIRESNESLAEYISKFTMLADRQRNG